MDLNRTQVLDRSVGRGCDHHIDVWFPGQACHRNGSEKTTKVSKTNLQGPLVYEVEAQTVLAVGFDGQASLSLNPLLD